MAKVIKLVIFLFVIVLSGCGTQGSSDSSSTDTPTDPGTTEPTVVSAIIISTASSTIGTGETAPIAVRLLDSSGEVVTGSKSVVFSLDNPTLASIPSPATTSSGLLTRTLTAGNTEGTVKVTASVDGASASVTVQISDQLTAASISLAASPSSITVGGTSVVSATVLDGNGNPMADGTTVNFSVNNSSLGSIVPSADISGGQGVAQATFSAGTSTAGTATITASSGVVSGQTTISVAGATAGSIEFVSAEPQVVVIKGSGGAETSTITFHVKDSNGNLVASSENVLLELSGPNGGEYIGPVSGVKSLEVGTESGIVSTTLHSGTIPGTVTITATVEGSSLKTSSGVIAIGGGVPSEGHFSLSTTKLNLEGLKYDGITADINVRLADRYGNYNVLEGTSVSFYSECGAIDRAVNLDAEGEGTVTFRTQQPFPQNVSISAFDDTIADDFFNYLGIVINDTHSPRDGLCTIVAVVDGEEEFTDQNANGLFDDSELGTIVDTYDDIHLDKDDDPMTIPYGSVTPGHPYDSAFEDLIVDRNENGSFDGMNNAWDSNKRISHQIKLLFTGVPAVSIADSFGSPVTASDTISVVDGGSQLIYFSLHDINFNPPIAGTKVTVSSEVGVLTGTKDYTYVDTSSPGAPIFSVIISDSKPGDSDPADIGVLEFSWSWKGTDYSYSVLVSVD